MPTKVKCKHCAGVRKVRFTDKNDKPTGEWTWFSDCDLFGDEQEVGYDCGKGHCDCYARFPEEGGAS